MSNDKVDGSIEINLLPSAYSIFLFIFIILIGESLTFIPDNIIFSVVLFFF